MPCHISKKPYSLFRVSLFISSLAIAALVLPAFAATNQVQGDSSVSVSAVSSAVAPPVSADAGKQWNLIFNEDFDNPSLDLNKWTPCFSWAWDYNGCTSSFNNGKEAYDASQVRISNGTAKLVAEPKEKWGKPYTSGLLSTTNKPSSLTGGKPGPSLFKFTYGYVEGRMKLPKEKGFFSAFWMLPVSSPDTGYAYPYEVDILEALGGSDPYAYQTVHYANRSRSFQAQPAGKCQNWTADSLYGQFHTFGVDWQPGYLDFYIDGIRCSRFTGEVWNSDMELIINHMVDVDWQRLYPSLYGASGSATMEVDYVKVWQQRPGTASPDPTTTTTATTLPATTTTLATVPTTTRPVTTTTKPTTTTTTRPVTTTTTTLPLPPVPNPGVDPTLDRLVNRIISEHSLMKLRVDKWDDPVLKARAYYRPTGFINFAVDFTAVVNPDGSYKVTSTNWIVRFGAIP